MDVPVIAFRLCTGMDLLPLTKAYYRHERMISEYRKLYREVEEAYGRDWI